MYIYTHIPTRLYGSFDQFGDLQYRPQSATINNPDYRDPQKATANFRKPRMFGMWKVIIIIFLLSALHHQDESFDTPRYILLPYFSAERFPGQKLRFTWPAWRSNDPGIDLYFYKVPGGEPGQRTFKGSSTRRSARQPHEFLLSKNDRTIKGFHV